MDKMTEAQVTEALKAAPEWSLVGEAIQRTYQFIDFVVAMKFVNAVAGPPRPASTTQISSSATAASP